jgi:parallel beta-helix repeat protein
MLWVPEMRERGTSIILLLVLSSSLVLIPELGIVEAESRTLVVPDDYATIQEAVHNSIDGDTVFVKSGTYNESVFIYKSISIVGEDEETTVIVGDYLLNGTVVLVSHDHVNVTGFTIQSPNVTMSRRGIHLLDVYNCNISGNKIMYNHYGIWLYNASENTIVENTLRNNSYGIQLEASMNNTLSRNLVEDNRAGFVLTTSNGNRLFENYIINNAMYGIKLDSDRNIVTDNIIRHHEFGVTVNGENNVLRNNTMENNHYNFGVDQNLGLTSPSNDVDISNTVNGKPIVYWVNQQDRVIPSNAGYVALINCTRITAENLVISNNSQGILLGFTSNSSIAHNTIIKCFDSIVLHESSGNIVYENDVLENWYGIILGSSSNNTVYDNTMGKSGLFGLDLRSSSNNSIFGNRISATSGSLSCGIKLTEAFNNVVSGNNIESNGYAGFLFDGGTVGPSLNNTIFGNNVTKHDYCIIIRGNSSYNNFYSNNFLEYTKNALKEYTEEPFSGVGIDNCFDNGVKGNYWGNYNGTDANFDGLGDTPYVINNYNQDNYPLMNPVDISVIPEFPSWTILPLLVLTIVVVIFYRKKMHRTRIQQSY